MSRSRSIPPTWLVFGGMFAALVILGYMLVKLPDVHPSGSSKPALIVYCGAGIRVPAETIAKQYEKDHGITIAFPFGPSQTLLSQAELSHTGDVFLPGDDYYVEQAGKKNLVDESVPIAQMSPVLVVKKGNPKHIRSSDDLLRSEVRLIQALPEGAAIGRMVKEVFELSEKWKGIESNTLVFTGTVIEVANAIQLGAADTGFVWSFMLKQYPDLESVPLPQLAGTHAQVSASTLKSSSQISAAREFVQYLAAKDGGVKVFRDAGFDEPGAFGH